MSGSVPNTPPGISPTPPYTVWTPAQWIAAWQAKADVASVLPTAGGTLTGPLRLLNVPVGLLPAMTLADVGSMVFATDGRNTGEGATVGTGCLVQVQNKGGTATWCAVWSGVAVTA